MNEMRKLIWFFFTIIVFTSTFPKQGVLFFWFFNFNYCFLFFLKSNDIPWWIKGKRNNREKTPLSWSDFKISIIYLIFLLRLFHPYHLTVFFMKRFIYCIYSWEKILHLGYLLFLWHVRKCLLITLQSNHFMRKWLLWRSINWDLVTRRCSVRKMFLENS